MTIDADAWELSALIRDKPRCDQCKRFLDNPHIPESRRLHHDMTFCRKCAGHLIYIAERAEEFWEGKK